MAGLKLFAPPPSRQGKTFRAPPLKEWKLFVPPYNMAKTLSYHVKTTPKLFVPPLSRFVAPPLPVISDQSLGTQFFPIIVIMLPHNL